VSGKATRRMLQIKLQAERK